MELFDLRNIYIRPKDFENIIDPLQAKRRVKESYRLEKTVGGMIGSLNGYMLKKNYGLRSYYSYDLYDQANWSKLDNDIDNGFLVLLEQRINRNDDYLYPFFISENGDLFCVNDIIYDNLFIKHILSYFSMKVLAYGKPSPTRSNFVPLTREYGPGYWQTTDNDYHALLNVGVMAINLATSMGDEGRPFMSEGKDFMNTIRDKIQVWSPLSEYIDNENKEIISNRSVIRRYGEQREIPQRYLESDDVWAAEGKSWHWIPTISDECYEFKK